MNGNANSSLSAGIIVLLGTQNLPLVLYFSFSLNERQAEQCLRWSQAFHLLSPPSCVCVLPLHSFFLLFLPMMSLFHLLNLQSKLCYQQPILNIWPCGGESVFSSHHWLHLSLSRAWHAGNKAVKTAVFFLKIVILLFVNKRHLMSVKSSPPFVH